MRGIQGLEVPEAPEKGHQRVRLLRRRRAGAGKNAKKDSTGYDPVLQVRCRAGYGFQVRTWVTVKAGARFGSGAFCCRDTAAPLTREDV